MPSTMAGRSSWAHSRASPSASARSATASSGSFRRCLTRLALSFRQFRVEFAVAVEHDPAFAVLDGALYVHGVAAIELGLGLDGPAGAERRLEVALSAAFLLEHTLDGRALDGDVDCHRVARALARPLALAGPCIGRLLSESGTRSCPHQHHAGRHRSQHCSL